MKNQEFASWPNLDAQILMSPSPVSLAKDLWVWVEKKGWPLNSEVITKSHLADILFLASFACKLPNKVNVVICSVAYILWNLSYIDVLDATSNNIDQISIKLSDPIISLNLAVSSAKNFLEATTQQQASDLISIKEVIVWQDELIKYIKIKHIQPAPSSFAAQIIEAQCVQEDWVAVQESSGLHTSVTSKA